jgi:hypothetical protein
MDTHLFDLPLHDVQICIIPSTGLAAMALVKLSLCLPGLASSFSSGPPLLAAERSNHHKTFLILPFYLFYFF